MLPFRTSLRRLAPAVLSAITLSTDLGGATYPWSSPIIVGLIAAAFLALGFVPLVGEKVFE